jgi:hypothetical protein
MGGAGPTYLKVLNRNNQIVRASDVIFDEDKPHLDCPYDSETEKQGTIAETVTDQPVNHLRGGIVMRLYQPMSSSPCYFGHTRD